MPFKIKTFGWRNKTLDQISRIDEGLTILGHELVNENPEIAYSNNDMYDDVLEFANRQNERPFVILNVLDLQIGNLDYELEKVKNQLLEADLVTCISESVKVQIKQALNIEAEVIHNPVKDFFLDGASEKKFLFLYVGRANDPRKRFGLIRDSLSRHEKLKASLIVCGSENPDFGFYNGVISDENLNFLYNSSKFLLLPSRFEGLGLPMIEAMITGTIPIVCDDNPTALEFCPKEFITAPNPDDLLKKIIELGEDYDNFRKIAIEYGEKYKILMNKERVAQNIIDLYRKAKC